MKTVTARPLTAEAFAPYGSVADISNLKIWCRLRMPMREPAKQNTSASTRTGEGNVGFSGHFANGNTSILQPDFSAARPVVISDRGLRSR